MPTFAHITLGKQEYFLKKNCLSFFGFRDLAGISDKRTKEELKIEIPTGSFKTPMQLLQTLNALLSSSVRPDLVERLERYQAIIAKLKVDAQQKVEQEISALTHRSNETKGSAVEEAEPPKLSEKMHRKMYDDYYLKLFRDAFPDKGEQEFMHNMLLHTNDVIMAFGTWIHAYKQARNCCKFVYSEERQHFSLSLNTDFVESDELFAQLVYIMGFERQRLGAANEIAKFIPDMTGGVSSFNVYAPGLIEPVMVGDVTAPLLRMVNIHAGLNDEVVEENYFAIQYHKLLVKEVSEISIEIRSASGNLMPFQFGTCTLTLHFKKAAYF